MFDVLRHSDRADAIVREKVLECSLRQIFIHGIGHFQECVDRAKKMIPDSRDRKKWEKAIDFARKYAESRGTITIQSS